MKLLDQVLDGQCYTVRIWRDEVGPEAIDSYNWVATLPDGVSRKNYEEQQIKSAMALSALYLPANTEPVVIKSDKTAIANLESAKAEADADVLTDESQSNG